MYDVALWRYYSVTAFNKFRAAYNKCIKKLFGYARSDSISGIFLELVLPTVLVVMFSGLLTLLYCNFFFMVLCGILACLF